MTTIPLPEVVRYVLDDGETCPAVVTKWHDNGRASLRVVLSADQASRYAKDGWWNPEYLQAMGNLPPEAFCDPGRQPGEFYIP